MKNDPLKKCIRKSEPDKRDKEKVTARTEKEFIREVALDCVANLKDEDRAYICDNPCSIEYHFGYAMYIRNHYIHNKDFSEVNFEVEPDELSGCIMCYIFSLLLPNEYIYDDSFVEQLFDCKGFIRLRKKYKEIYGGYPVELLRKYRDKVPKAESKIDKMNKTEILKLPKDFDFDAEIEICHRDFEYRSAIISELISELAERIWRVQEIRNIAKECSINPEELNAKIKEIKDVFYTDKEYIPMVAVLLPYRDQIGEEKYLEYRASLCDELDRNSRLMEKLDKTYFSDREIAKVVLKYKFAMELLTEYQNDDEMVRYALEHNGDAIAYVNGKYLHDRDWVRFAIEHSENRTIMFLECMKPYRKDKEFVYLACKTDKWNFVYVDDSFHDDEELAHIVISDNRQLNNVFGYLSDRLRDDLSLALIDAAGEYPAVEEYSERLRDNEEVADKLIEAYGIDSWRFGYMSNRIKEKYGYKSIYGE